MSDRKAQPFDIVQKPKHYNNHPSGVEAIELCEVMTFNLGNAFKYVYRRGDKGNTLQDLNKALWYLEREIKRLSRYTWMPAIFQGMFKVNSEFSQHHEELVGAIISAETDSVAASFYSYLLVTGSMNKVEPSLAIACDSLRHMIEVAQTPDAPQAS